LSEPIGAVDAARARDRIKESANMFNAFRGSLLLVALAAVIPAVMSEQAVAFCRNCCCRVCQRQQCVCPTAAVQAVPQTTYQPVVETQYAQQPVLQQRDVVSTEYRNEAVTETVPSTVYENVMVDEGSYQTVWVPKTTVRTQARTVYQTRTSYRSTPYQVTRRVSEYGTQTLPYQTVRYVPTTTTGLAYTTTPSTTISALPYGSTYPVVSSTPIVNAPAIATSSGVNPVPDPRFSSAPATSIAPRTASNASSFDSTLSTTNDGIRSADRGPALFAPAPSAAQVWRTPRGTTMR
jgi:hypothetical protein